MTGKRSAAQLVVMIVLSAAVQLVNLATAGAQARTFGASASYDAFVLSRSVVAFALTLAGVGISVVLVPAFAQGRDRIQVNAFLTALTFVACGLGAFFALVAPFLLHVVGARDEVLAAAPGIVRIVVVTQLIGVGIGVVNAYLNATESFGWPQAIALAGALAVLLMLLADTQASVQRFACYGLVANAGVLALGGALAYKRGFSFRPAFSWRASGVWPLFVLLGPAVCSSGGYQLSVVVDSTLAARTGIGGPTYLYYASAVAGVANAVLMGNVQTFSYTKIARACVSGGLRRVLTRYTVLGVALASVTCAAFLAVGEEAIRILVGRTSISEDGVDVIVGCASVLLLTTIMSMVRQPVYNLFNAEMDTRTPFRVSLAANAANLAVSVVISRWYGLYGIVLGTLVSEVFAAAAIVYAMTMRHQVGLLTLVKPLLGCLAVGVSACAAGAAGRAAYEAGGYHGIPGVALGAGVVLAVFAVLVMSGWWGARTIGKASA